MLDFLWCDIIVENVDEFVSFYEVVMGWKKEFIDMGGYNDYVMMKVDGIFVGGICYKWGVNVQYLSGWINYFIVENLDVVLKEVIFKGGKQVGDICYYGKDSFCVIIDLSGVVCVFYEKGSK